MRILVDVPADDIEALDAAAERARQPRAALIREAVSDYLARHAVDAGEEAFGLWGGKVDGLVYQRKTRSEW